MALVRASSSGQAVRRRTRWQRLPLFDSLVPIAAAKTRVGDGRNWRLGKVWGKESRRRGGLG